MNIEIKGIKYEIEKEETADEIEARGLVNLARNMRENKVSRQLLLRRPNGKKLYFSNEFQTKWGLTYSKPFTF